MNEPEMLIRLVETALRKAHPEIVRVDTPRAIEDYRVLFDRVLPAARRVIRRVVAVHYAAEPDPDALTTLTPAQIDAATRHFREVLDLAPLSKPARLVYRPMWPMTLAQLRAQVAELPPDDAPRTNPSPLILRDRAIQKQYPGFAVSRALGARSDVDVRAAGVDPQTRADYRALAGVAWNLSVPEGFPPYPRRGGVYSDHEATAINHWAQSEWPVLMEADQIAAQKDLEVAQAGIPADRLTTLLVGIHTGRHTFREYLREWTQRHGVFPSAADKSPRDYHTAILRWARDTFLPTLDALEDFDVSLLERQPDPDAHMRALASNRITKYAVREAARHLYRLSGHSEPWTQALTGFDRSSKPTDLVSAFPEKEDTRYSRAFPLSVLLAAQAAHDADYAARRAAEEAATQRAIVVARNALRPLVEAGRPFTRAAIQSALPTFTLDVRDRYKPVHVSLRSPDAFVTYGSGPTLTAALADLRKNVGL